METIQIFTYFVLPVIILLASFFQTFLNQRLIEKMKIEIAKDLEYLKSKLSITQSEELRFLNDKRDLFLETYKIWIDHNALWQIASSQSGNKSFNMPELRIKHDELQVAFTTKYQLFDLYSFDQKIIDLLEYFIWCSSNLFTMVESAIEENYDHDNHPYVEDFLKKYPIDPSSSKREFMKKVDPESLSKNYGDLFSIIKEKQNSSNVTLMKLMKNELYKLDDKSDK